VKEEFAGLADILETLISRNESIAVAESLTGGGLAQALTSLPGSSQVFRGSVTAYQNEIKSSILQIPEELISEFGAVSEEVAAAMAHGIKDLMGSTWSISTTGVAGPGPVDGVPAGTVWVAIDGPISQTLQLELSARVKSFETQQLQVQLRHLPVSLRHCNFKKKTRGVSNGRSTTHQRWSIPSCCSHHARSHTSRCCSRCSSISWLFI
jgi:nicotinamide-nucleotide amidase